MHDIDQGANKFLSMIASGDPRLYKAKGALCSWSRIFVVMWTRENRKLWLEVCVQIPY